jgi:hypothetical protein
MGLIRRSRIRMKIEYLRQSLRSVSSKYKFDLPKANHKYSILNLQPSIINMGGNNEQ